MRIFWLRHSLVKSHVFQLSLITSIYWMALSLVETVWAVYMESMVGDAAIAGLIIGSLTMVNLVTAFIVPKLFSKFRGTEVYSVSLLGIIVSYTAFALTNNLLVFLGFALLLTIFEQTRASSLGIIFRDESGDDALDQNEGMMFMMSNMSYLFGPLIAGYVSKAMGVQPVFAITAILIFVIWLRFRQIGIKDREHHTKQTSMWNNLQKFWKNTNLLKSYLLNGGLNTWWAVSYIYVPMLIVQNGYDMGWIGLILFAMILPAIVLEYPAMKKARQIGYHNYFFFGYALLGAITIALSVLNSPWQILILFFVAGIASGVLEPTGETYFFKLVSKKEEENLYPPFLTSKSVMYGASVFVLALVINVVSFNALFLVAGTILLVYAIIGATAKKRVNK